MKIEQIKASRAHAFSTLSNLQASYRKVNLIMDAIRGADASEALFRLEFMRNKNAISIHKLLRSALSNADTKMIDGKLYVQHAFSSRAKVLKRIDFKGRGRSGVKEKPYCHVTLVLAARGAPGFVQAKSSRNMGDKVISQVQENIKVSPAPEAVVEKAGKSPVKSAAAVKKEGTNGSKS